MQEAETEIGYFFTLRLTKENVDIDFILKVTQTLGEKDRQTRKRKLFLNAWLKQFFSFIKICMSRKVRIEHLFQNIY